MILAEAVSLDGDAIFLLLVILILMFATVCGLVVYGCVLAIRARRGSGAALVGWIAIGVLEMLPLVLTGELNMPNLVGPLALVIQGLLFSQASHRPAARRS